MSEIRNLVQQVKALKIIIDDLCKKIETTSESFTEFINETEYINAVNIAEEICKDCNMSYAELLMQGQKMHKIDTLRAVIVAIHKCTKIDDAQIANIVNRNRTTIVYHKSKEYLIDGIYRDALNKQLNSELYKK